MPKRKTRKREPEIIDAEIVEVEAVERPSAPPIVIDVKAPAPPRARVQAFGVQAVVSDVKQAFDAGEKIAGMLRRLFR